MLSLIGDPQDGQPIRANCPIPTHPIIPFIEGDDIGVDITLTMIKAIDADVKKAYGEQKKICWLEVYAGEKALRFYGCNQYLP